MGQQRIGAAMAPVAVDEEKPGLLGPQRPQPRRDFEAALPAARLIRVDLEEQGEQGGSAQRISRGKA